MTSATTKHNAPLQNIQLAGDFLPIWNNFPEIQTPTIIKNTSDIIDLRSKNDTTSPTVTQIQRKFSDRTTKSEIVRICQNAKLKSWVIHSDHGRIAYHPRVSGLIDSRISANPKLYCWTKNDDKTAVSLSGTTLMLESPGSSGNYYHWSLEVMPRLWAILPYLRTGEIDRVAFWNQPSKGFQRDYINLLLGADLVDKVIYLDGKPTHFSQLYFFENRAISTRVTNLTVEFCRSVRRMFPHAGQDSCYVMRQAGNMRRLLQEETLSPQLQAHGFKMIEGGNHTLQEQIAMFANASRVVGVHGAGLTNLAFAQPNATFVELTSATYYRRVTYSDLALALGMKTRVVILDEVGEYKSNFDCPDLHISTERTGDLIDAITQ